MKFIIATIIIFCTFFSQTYCQNKNKIGLDVQLENESKGIVKLPYESTERYYQSSNFIIGISYERLLSKKSSIEIEFKYRHLLNGYSFFIPAGSNSLFQVNVSGKESFISCPILYKYSMSFINISLGPTLDYFLQWKQTTSNSGFLYQKQLADFFFPNKLSLGFLIKISKSIKIYKKIVTEPGIFYNPIVSYQRNYFGLSITTKYSF